MYNVGKRESGAVLNLYLCCVVSILSASPPLPPERGSRTRSRRRDYNCAANRKGVGHHLFSAPHGESAVPRREREG